MNYECDIMFRKPLVVILGATGTGKSKLAVEIAKKFRGEVISADSMQLYKGLDIITNKVTREEMDGVKHHMMDVMEPPSRYTVVDFRNQALPIIKRLHKRGELPVVVGGTNYYIESLIWKVLIEEEDSSTTSPAEDLVFCRAPYSETLKIVSTLIKIRYIAEFCQFCEKVFMAYLNYRIESMPRFHVVIGDLLDSPANFSDSLLIHKATDVLDEIADYELGSIMMCTRYRWIMEDFRQVEKHLIKQVPQIFNLIREHLDLKRPFTFGYPDPALGDIPRELEEQLLTTFKNFHKGLCLQDIEFNVSDHPIPAEYSSLSIRLEELRDNNCFTEIKHFMDLLLKLVYTLDYDTLIELSGEVNGCSSCCQDLLLPRLVRIMAAEYIWTEPIPDCIPSEEDPEIAHEILGFLDPKMASMLHPMDTRKVLRSIQVCLQRGRRHSEIISEQKNSRGGSSLGGPLRFDNCAIFWLQCDPEVLDVRLDKRVDEMMSRGLVKELLSFHNKYKEVVFQTEASQQQHSIQQQTLKSAYTQGIFQSIGFKEFHTYLQLSEEERNERSGRAEQALQEGLSLLRLATKRYAKRQNKWIKQRFIMTHDRHVPPVYALNTNDPQHWERDVLEPATAVVQCLLGRPTGDVNRPQPVYRPARKPSDPTFDNKSNHYCETCRRVFIGDVQWNAHIASKKHQKMERRKKLGIPLMKKETKNKSKTSSSPSTSCIKQS